MCVLVKGMHAGDLANGVHVHEEDRKELWTLFLTIAVYFILDTCFLTESRDCWLGQASWLMSSRDPHASASLVIILLMHESIAVFFNEFYGSNSVICLGGIHFTNWATSSPAHIMSFKQSDLLKNGAVLREYIV